MTHTERANELLKQDYHCSQALFGAFAGDLGLDIKTALKLSTCFGVGMRQGDVCGCVTASLMILGMAFGFDDPQDRELEVFGNKKTEEFVALFKEAMGGSYLCKDILHTDVSRPEGMARMRQERLKFKICPHAMAASIEILERMLAEYQDNRQSVDMMTLRENNGMASGLRNSNQMVNFRRNALDLLNNSESKIAYIQFDIRRFKVINDIYGEKIGDEILDFVTEGLRRICGEHQYFVSLRGDVFMIVTQYEQEAELTALVNRIRQMLGNFKGIKIQYTFGIYMVNDRKMELRQMGDRAAMARMAAKESVMKDVVFYQEKFKELLYMRRFIEENMKAAIAQRQFQMYLQPKYSISHNAIVGAEALVRWLHPVKGIIYPSEFIPVLEENGFIRNVDYYIWEEACRFIKRCEQEGMEGCPVSVNVSRHHLVEDEFIEVLDGLIDKIGIDKQSLELEITETVNNQQVSEMSNRLKDEGFMLLMDDFGSGYSSLSILLETPFDVIKIDKKFMENMLVSKKGKLILEQVVAMAGKLDLGLLAEGVETREQVEFLKEIGCDMVQGFYYAKPMPAEEFYELLKQDRDRNRAK
ncbi:MAG: EAL domain-containing protein [Lachnospiraceae bacterium]|jgi:C_GCAxxG_C_C family probable redox protein|nr:EAL domain-containing protein [Lachnospiraceae bacterium]